MDISCGGRRGGLYRPKVEEVLLQIRPLIERFNGSALSSLVYVLEATSPWTLGHSDRTTRLALQIGRAMELSPGELWGLKMGALLHDIGKLAVGPELLNKTGPLTEAERELIREHVYVGAQLLEPFAPYRVAVPVILQHHERFDGSGYPRGLAGPSICLEARILAVADVYDALTAERPYRGAFDRHRALQFIKERSGSWFDPEVVEAFLEVCQGPISP